VVSSLDVGYRIDSSDRITTVSEGWVSFAMENGGKRLLPPGILGTSLWPWIVDPTTRHVYRSLLARVRKGAGAVRFQFRCDGPDRRRLLQMQITLAASDYVDFQTTLLRKQPRAEVGLMDPATIRSDALLTICGWCMRVPVSGKWVEIEEAVPALGLLEAFIMPQLSHGMCPACYNTMLTAIDDSDLSASGQVTVGALP
jgi:hypothetical protein